MPPEDAPSWLSRYLLRCSLGSGVLDCGDCRSNVDCKEGEACLTDPRTRRMQCLASECSIDTDCGRSVCRVVPAGNSFVRRCIQPGTQAENEPCFSNPLDRSRSCALGLVCNMGYCQRPCASESDHSCPGNARCASTENGWACVPSCEQRECQEGRACVHPFGPTEMSFCGRQVGDNCQDNPCAVGSRCLSTLSSDTATVTFTCRRACQPDADSTGCRPDEVCGSSGAGPVCFRSCRMEHFEDCEPTEICSPVDDEGFLLGCRPY